MHSVVGNGDGVSSFEPGGPRASRRSLVNNQRTQPTSPQSQLPAITRPLVISLEDLFTGTTKRMKISRRLHRGGTQDKVIILLLVHRRVY